MKVLMMFAASAVSALFVLPTVSQAETRSALDQAAQVAGSDCGQQRVHRLA